MAWCLSLAGPTSRKWVWHSVISKLVLSRRSHAAFVYVGMLQPRARMLLRPCTCECLHACLRAARAGACACRHAWYARVRTRVCVSRILCACLFFRASVPLNFLPLLNLQPLQLYSIQGHFRFSLSIRCIMLPLDVLRLASPVTILRSCLRARAIFPDGIDKFTIIFFFSSLTLTSLGIPFASPNYSIMAKFLTTRGMLLLQWALITIANDEAPELTRRIYEPAGELILNKAFKHSCR